MNSNSKHYDWVIIAIYVLLVSIGWLNIFAADYKEATFEGIFNFSERYGKQLVWIGTAILFIVMIMLISPKFFSNTAIIFFLIGIALLFFVLIFGVATNNSKSWFRIGSMAFQPAEFVKISTALFFSWFLGYSQSGVRDNSSKYKAISIFLAPIVLIILQNDTGTALVFLAFILVLIREGLSPVILVVALLLALFFILTILFGQLIISISLISICVLFLVIRKGLKRRQYIRTISIFALLIFFVFSTDFVFNKVLESHQQERINVLLGLNYDPQGVGYNVDQSKIAIGSGGLTGKGFLKGTQTKFDFVPEQDTDFIFCTIGEEWGFMGSSFVVCLFAFLIMRIIYRAEKHKSRFSRIYGYSVASILLMHFFINIGMTLGLIPVVGIPLPFISYGGSSLWAFTIMLFIFVKQDGDSHFAGAK